MDIKRHRPKNNRPQIITTQTSLPTQPATPVAHTPKKKKSVKRIILGCVGILTIGLGVVLFTLAQKQDDSETPISDVPSYDTVLPEGKTPATLGGWKRVSPPENSPVYAYNDTIDDVTISVSQQPLPAQFKRNTDTHITTLAKSYNATKKLTAEATTFYLGTSAKGPQSVILTKNDLLILMKSEKTIADASWSAYVKSLTDASLGNMPKY